MKQDTQHRQSVSKRAAPAPIGDPREALLPKTKSASVSNATGSSAHVSVTLSARYIDSRLKQFCCR